MSVKKSVEELIEQVTQSLIAGEFVVTRIDDYTTKLEKDGETLEIWTASNWDGCKVYRAFAGLSFPDFKTDEIKKQVFKIATTKTLYMLKLKLEEATANAKEASDRYNRLEEVVANIVDEMDEFNANELKKSADKKLESNETTIK
jgi:hypothetical protein